MGPKRVKSQKISLFLVKFKKLGFSAPLMIFRLRFALLLLLGDSKDDVIKLLRRKNSNIFSFRGRKTLET